MSSKPPDKMQPTTPPMNPALQRQRLSLLAWMRVGFGGVAGLIAGILGLVTTLPPIVNSNAYYGLYIAIVVYLGSYYFAKYYWVKGINPKDKNKLFTQGIGSFIMMFLFVWIVYNTYYYCTFVGACVL